MAAFSPRDENAFIVHWKAKILGDQTVVKKTILFEREIGYRIGREYWGRGVATAALARFLRLVSERPLYAVVAKHNRASIRVLEKSRFSIEGTGGGVHDANRDAVEELVMKLGQDDQGSVADP